MNDERYEETVASSKEESMLKAMSLFYESLAEKERKIVRPDIDVKKTLATALIIVGLWFLGAAGTIVAYIRTESLLVLFFCIAALVILVALTFKKAMVLSVLLYQRLAPERLRKSCLFTPSCSEYMLLAIEKYGIWKGFYLGIKRLLRCHEPNGGVDYP